MDQVFGLTGLDAFFAMGGYAAYIWPSYALAIGGTGFLTIGAIRRYRAAERALAALQGRRPGDKA